MRIRVFILAMALLALVGVCVVQQATRQARAQYTLARLQDAERRQQRELDSLLAREAALLGMARLNTIADRSPIPYKALRRAARTH